MDDLEQRLNKLKNEIGLVGGRLKFSVVSGAKRNITAGISPQDWHIELTVSDSFNPVPDRRTRQYVKKKNITRPLDRICEDMVYHECGHWELPRTSGFGCPYSPYYLDEILDGTSAALTLKGRNPDSASSGQALKTYMANAFTDLVDNINCSQRTSFTGQVLFWNDQGLQSEDGKFPRFYEAFVRLNMYCWGDKIDEQLLSRFYTSDRKVIEAVQQVIKVLGLNRDKEQARARLFRKDEWKRMASDFARIMAELLDEQEQEQQQMFGSGTSMAAEKLKFKDEKEKLVYERYSQGKGRSGQLDSFEQLDLLYKRISRSIRMKAESITESLSFPIANYGKQAYDPERDDLRKEKARGYGINPDGTVGLRIARGQILTEAGYRRNIREFPKLKVVLLDTSGSMKENPDGSAYAGDKSFIPWGDDSKYHYALKGWYGIQNFLEQQGFARYVDNSLVNFSDATIASGRKKPENIGEVKKLLLSPQFGYTTLDTEVLEKQLERDGFLISISDGEISNWTEIKDSYKAIVQGSQYAHIQIGEENKFTADLKSWGMPVYTVKGNDDLSGLMVDLASSYYKDYAFAKAAETRRRI